MLVHIWESSLERCQSEAQITYAPFVPCGFIPGLSSSPASSVEDRMVPAFQRGFADQYFHYKGALE